MVTYLRILGTTHPGSEVRTLLNAGTATSLRRRETIGLRREMTAPGRTPTLELTTLSWSSRLVMLAVMISGETSWRGGSMLWGGIDEKASPHVTLTPNTCVWRGGWAGWWDAGG